MASIVPWNFPFANFVWDVLQGLIAGNTVVFKHSEECPLCGKFLEEVFGPVLPIVTFKTEEEALKLANETSYGLGSYLFTADKKRAERLARQIQSGMVGINGVSYIMPFNPFGGYKNSGFGREHGEYGFHEVTQIKVVSRPK